MFGAFPTWLFSLFIFPKPPFPFCLSRPTSPSQSLYSLSLSKTSFSSSRSKPYALLTSHPPLSNQPALLSNFPSVSNDTVNDHYYLLDLSVRYDDVELIKAVHASIFKLAEDIRLANALIVAYLKLGMVPNAHKVFVGLSCPNVVSYTAMISGFAKSNRERQAMENFFRMRSSGIELNEFSFVAILTVCIRLLDLELGCQLHAIVIKMGFLNYTFVSNALMGLYGKCGYLDTVLQLFDEMPHRDIASWNTVISSVVKEMMYERAFELFRDMRRIDGFRIDHFTLSTILVAARGLASMVGREIHAHVIKIGFESNISVINALIRFYTKCGSIKHVVALFEKMRVRDVITWTEMITAYMEFGLTDLALEVFDKMPARNSISYNAILSGFCQNGEGSKALAFFCRMVEEGVELTDFTLTGVLNACGLLMEAKISKQIHGFILKFGFGSNACIEAALLDMCTRCGRMADAQKMFSQGSFSQSGSIIWTSMICGYARNAQPEEAISLFCRSQLEGAMVVDKVASTAVLGVCGTLAFHEMGKQIHCHALKSGFLSDLGVGNSIITMYSKCSNMDDAIKVFNVMPAHDIVSWNGLIAGHLLHRQGDEALSVWSKMEKAEHYTSLVGVLGYWGLLEEAEEMINKMPIEPEASV
ncbi:Pentatricopeptide repeat-containing protein, partial [Vitis vinifera]